MDRKEFFIEMTWGRLAVVTYYSKDLPLVIFCHGRSDSADTFLPLIELLPPTHHYVTFDLAGCGYSDKLPVGSLFITFVFLHMLKAVADHYGDKKFVFIGHSLGAQLGILYNIITDGSRITKYVDIDSLSAHQVEPYPVDTYPDEALPEGGFSLKQWLTFNYIDFYSPKYYSKMNGSIETAPSYTMEQALELVKTARHLPLRSAEIVLQRNIRPDPKNPGKFKFVWDQRMKRVARSPFSADFWFAVRKRYALPTLLFGATKTYKGEGTAFTMKMIKVLQQNMPYFKPVLVESFHDVHLIAPEKLAPHITEFLDMDLSQIKTKQLSKM